MIKPCTTMVHVALLSAFCLSIKCKANWKSFRGSNFSSPLPFLAINSTQPKYVYTGLYNLCVSTPQVKFK